MTRLLILGGSGMLGHKLWQTARTQLETYATVRSAARLPFPASEMIQGVDASQFDSVVRAFAAVRPDVVVNCIGIVKRVKSDTVDTININALFPHRVAALCKAAGARLIHISTDCVFAGTKGMYTEDDFADADDLYGRTKLLGETGEGLTIRTSMIGRELSTHTGLLEWFLSNEGGRVSGYEKAIFSGFTTLELSRILLSIIQEVHLSGVMHVSAEPIDKYTLLGLIRDAFGMNVTIERDASLAIDRSLDSSRFRALTGYTPPPWPDMIRELAADAKASSSSSTPDSPFSIPTAGRHTRGA
jgi:dTDP-4-dehydrorhamnose reductase